MTKGLNAARGCVLITGASSGIGAATARRAAEDGWDVAINYVSDRPGAEATARSVAATGRRALVVQADVSDPAAVSRMFADVDRMMGDLNALVNNAGIVDAAARVEEISPERLERMFAINVFGAFHCAREAVLRMAFMHGGPGGVIVNVSSMAATLGGAGNYVDYAASKGAIDSMTRGLALEVAPEGIRVAGIRPGIIETPIHGKGGLPDRAVELGPAQPIGRAGTPEEVADAVVWLMSDRASYITGTTLDVSGGR